MRKFTIFVASTTDDFKDVAHFISVVSRSNYDDYLRQVEPQVSKKNYYFKKDFETIAVMSFLSCSHNFIQTSAQLKSCRNEDIIICLADSESAYSALKTRIESDIRSTGVEPASYFMYINVDKDYRPGELEEAIRNSFRYKLIEELSTYENNLSSPSYCCGLFQSSNPKVDYERACVDTVMEVFNNKNLFRDTRGNCKIRNLIEFPLR